MAQQQNVCLLPVFAPDVNRTTDPGAIVGEWQTNTEGHSGWVNEDWDKKYFKFFEANRTLPTEDLINMFLESFLSHFYESRQRKDSIEEFLPVEVETIASVTDNQHTRNIEVLNRLQVVEPQTADDIVATEE